LDYSRIREHEIYFKVYGIYVIKAEERDESIKELVRFKPEPSHLLFLHT